MSIEDESSYSPGLEALAGRLFTSSEYFEYFLDMPDRIIDELANSGYPFNEREQECMRLALGHFPSYIRINRNTGSEDRERAWTLLFASVIECLQRPSKED